MYTNLVYSIEYSIIYRLYTKCRLYTDPLNKYQTFKIIDITEGIVSDHNKMELKTNKGKIFLT